MIEAMANCSMAMVAGYAQAHCFKTHVEVWYVKFILYERATCPSLNTLEEVIQDILYLSSFRMFALLITILLHVRFTTGYHYHFCHEASVGVYGFMYPSSNCVSFSDHLKRIE